MATSGSVFSETLQEITNTKLKELSKRRTSFEQAKQSLLLAVKAEEDAVKRLTTLKDGTMACFGIKVDKNGTIIVGHTKDRGLETELKNIHRFIDQAKYDPSVSIKMLESWEQGLLRHLDMQSLQFQYASLYGQLVTEWLSRDKQEDSSSTAEDVEMSHGFEDIGNAKKLESKMEWEKIVFEPALVDIDDLESYLDDLFGVGNEEKKEVEQALSALRDAVYSFETRMSAPNQFNVATLRWVIKGLHASSLLSDEKRQVLKDFEDNTIILSEIADVLNMRISDLSSWSWSSDTPVPLEVRRTISGLYNIHMQEDLLQAIFLEYIGVKWSVFFKRQFKLFRQSDGAWKSTFEGVPKIDRRRLGYYLGELDKDSCLRTVRDKIHRNFYFAAQLRDNEEQHVEASEGEVEAEYQQVGQKRKRSAVVQNPMAMVQSPMTSRKKGVIRHRSLREVRDDDDDDDIDKKKKNPMELKQMLLHLVSTEAAINTRLWGEMTAFHSVFESWNPQLPHEAILIILKYFGVSRTWLYFFQKFLEAPLKFMEDDDSTPARRRRRGTPSAHVLSEVFGETTLFCLDLSINRSTTGHALWRVQDDFWFWSPNHDVAVKAWNTVREFASVTGTQVNVAKTGTVRVSKNGETKLPVGKELPEGEIRWGFLRLSPDTGRFEIDQAVVDHHIKDLRKQLGDKSKSVLDFIQTWNSYAATFFTSNFGKPANCFGQQHVDNMLATHQRIQKHVFATLTEGDGGGSSSNSKSVRSVADFLKRTIGERFGIDDIPDGYLYFPMELGGLDLQSPFISLLQIRDNIITSPSALLEDFERAELIAYQEARKAFLDGSLRNLRYGVEEPDWAPNTENDRKTFMSFAEYVRHREHFQFPHQAAGRDLEDIFHRLMRRPTQSGIDIEGGNIGTALAELESSQGGGGSSSTRVITGGPLGMEPYWRWVTMMYGPEIVERFGRLNIVNPGLLPMGMVRLFRDRRVKWQG